MTRNTYSRVPLKKIWMTVGFSAMCVTSVTATELDAEAIARGKTVSATCVACHQADGSGMNIPGGESWPRLSGLNRDYLVDQLQAFKDGARQSPSMFPFASMLNDEQMVDVASYYASLPVTPVKVPAMDEDLLKHGKKLAISGDWDRYIVSCNSCHGVSSLVISPSKSRPGKTAHVPMILNT